MTDPNKEAAGILRGIVDRIARLEESVSTSEGIVNPLRQIADKLTSTDDVTVTTENAGSFTWDTDNWDAEKWQ